MIFKFIFIVLLLGSSSSQEAEGPSNEFPLTTEATNDEQGVEEDRNFGAPPREDSGVPKVRAFPISSSQIQLEWDVPPPSVLSGVQYYRVNYVKIGGVRDREDIVFFTFVILSQLRPFSLYEIRIFAESGTGSYEYPLTTVKTFEDVPSAVPRNIVLTPVSSSAITVTWQPPQVQRHNGIIVSYKMRYRPVGTTDTSIVSVSGGEMSLIITGLSRDTSYEFRLAAATVNGTGPYSPWKSAKTLNEEPEPEPPAIVGLSVDPSVTYAIVSWVPPVEGESSFEGYILGYGFNSPDEFMVTIQGTDVSSYKLTGLSPNTSYKISLRSFNGLGDGDPVLESFTTLSESQPRDGPPVVTPSSFELNPEATRIQVMWSLPPYEGGAIVHGYILHVISQEGGQIRVELNDSHDSYVVSDLIPGTEYTVVLKAFNDVGESVLAEESVFTLPAPVVPAMLPSAPLTLDLTPSSSYVIASWTMPKDVAGVTGFSLYYGIDIPDHSVYIDGGESSFNVTNLAPDSTYIFKLAAVNDIGESRSIHATTSTLPNPIELAPAVAPFSLELSPSRTSMLVSWETTDTETVELDGFILGYGIISSLENLLLIDADQTSVTAENLRPGTTYYFSLSSFNAMGDSAPVTASASTLSEIVETTIRPSGACETDNGGCSHDCVTLEDGGFECQCPDGYRLDSNQKECIDINECEEDPFICGSFATCVNTFGGYECPCKTGFVYPDNEEDTSGNCVDVDECEFKELIPILCGPHSSCRNTDGSYECECLPGFIMDVGFCFDLNECEEGNPCGVDGFCENLEGSFNCSCGDGYTSQDGECIDIDECSLEGESSCPETMSCVNYEGSYHCFCPPGFSGNGSYCEDINECATPDHQCSTNSFCGNLVGSYYCQCNQGYVGNGRDCYDVNECDSSNGGCPQVCVNTPGSFHCTCSEGFRPSETDPDECEDINECALETSKCDQICLNNIGSYTCSCERGFMLHVNGFVCVDINECLYGVCEEICVNLPGSFRCECNDMRALIPGSTTHCKDVTNCQEKNGGCAQVCRKDQRGILCSCDDGYTIDEDGRSCNDVNECLESNGGCEQMCTNTPGSYACGCRRGYRPRDDNPYQCISECNPPCLNYGICIGPNTCVCPAGYGGDTCQPTCNPPCAHGGSCRRFNMCHCPAGYTGPGCQKATCALPCMNGGHCIGPDTCQCPARYTGERCETPKCVPPCRNGGSCYTVNTCICPQGFFGPRCQNERSMCSPGFCKNGGVCIGVNKCRCTSQFRGTRCAVKIQRKCIPACQNGGTCLDNNRCSCPNGVTGVRCQRRTCAVESYQTTHIEFKNRYVTEMYSGACGPFGFRVCQQYRFVTKRVSEIVYRAAYRSTC